MSLLLLLIPGAAAVLLDLTLSPALRILGAHPSFSVALVATWAVLRRREETMVLAPATGLLLGLLGNEPLGASVLALTPVVMLGWLRDPAETGGRFAATLGVAAVGAAAYVAVVALAAALTGRALPAPAAAAQAMAGAALLTVPPAAVLYWPLARAAWQPRVRGEFRRY